MANKCIPNLKDGKSSKNNLKRNNYFKGKLLTASDFSDEQDYLTDKIRRLSNLTNGSGVIEGLKVASKNETTITLTPGAAIDTHGNLLYLNVKTPFDVPTTPQENDYIYLQYIERGKDKVSVQNAQECSDDCCYNKIEEDFEVILSTKLLTSTPKNICQDSENKTSLNNEDKPLVLIGRIYKGGAKYKEVNAIYKNSELSQRLCEISNEYVISVNGKKGEVSAVSSINGITPDEQGELNFVAGNNISIEGEGNDLTISSSNGFYRDYYITLFTKPYSTNTTPDSHTITHNARRFPVVDIYKREKNTSSEYYAIRDTELLQQARDTNKPFYTLKKELDAELLIDYIKDKTLVVKKTTPNGPKKGTVYHMSEKELATYLSSKKKVASELIDTLGVATLSPKVLKLSDMELSKVIGNIYILPNYKYTKVVGVNDSSINLEVSHLNVNSLKITNKAASNISLLVVLST